MRKILSLLIIPVLLFGCAKVKEAEVPQELDGLHEVVFHAGWDPETRTELQEDGSVWWSPEDEISLFVGDGENGGYKLVSTNTEPAAKVDFVGQIGDKPENASYIAVYPYSESTWVSEGNIYFTVPSEQIAKEGTFENGSFVSYAVSDDESLLFHNLCGGIKFSVAHEGIKKVEITTMGAPLAGDMGLYSDGVIHNDLGSYTITVVAPNDCFETGKYYYAVVGATEEYSDEGHFKFKVSFYTDETVATTYLPGCRFQRSVFKRLYEADKDLKFKKYYDRIAYLPYDFLPEGVDKTVITEAYFHVSDPKTTDIVVSAGGDDSEPIYFEMIGTTAHFYTEGQAYKCYNVNFEGWKSLRSLDLSMFDVSDAVSMSQAFMDCHSLRSLDLSSFDTSNVTMSFGNMFYKCVNLKELDVTGFDTSKAVDFYNMFGECISLEELDVSKFDTHSAESFYSMFLGCRNLRELDVSSFDTSNCTDMSEMFAGCERLESIDVSHFNTTNVKKTSAMFAGCTKLRSIDLSSFHTDNLEIMSYMFSNCLSLEQMDLSSFDMSNVVGVDGLFYLCSSLKSVIMPSTPATKVQWMQYMFVECTNLEQIDLSIFDTSNVTQMVEAFRGCSSLKSLDLSHFHTSNVTSMSHMFSGCRNLESLDISSFDSSSLTEAYNLFYDTYKLTSLNLGDFDLRSVAIDGAGQWLGDLTAHCHIRCTSGSKDALIASASRLSQEKYIWYTDGSPLPDVHYEPENGLYCSSDYSKDKTVRTVQLASDGSGIDLVLMGDAYSDRLIANGKYDADMEKAIDAIFAEEPFKSFKHLFNIYIVYAVSENEIIGKSTALAGFNRGVVGSEGWAWQTYYFCAANNSSSGERSPVIILNDAISNGTATGFLSATQDDYMNNPLRDDYHGGFSDAIAYISGPDDERFDYTIRHEFGHTFGLLMDEYNKYSDTIPDWEITSWKLCFAYGMWRNVDLVSDDTVKWAKFIHDERYAGTGMGVYEGALYAAGAWRPSPESIMNSTDSGYNAPSREAIYYRIHKLAYGDDWNYNFEDFVRYDMKNIETDKIRSSATTSQGMHAKPVFIREPVFRKSVVSGPDGKPRVKIEMN